MPAKSYISAIVLLFLTLGLGFAYQGCVGASDREAQYTLRVNRNAKTWIIQNRSLDLNSDTLVCEPRTFGSRWPDDFHVCSVMSNVQVPGRGSIPLHLLCNIQGCILNPHHNTNN